MSNTELHLSSIVCCFWEIPYNSIFNPSPASRIITNEALRRRNYLLLSLLRNHVSSSESCKNWMRNRALVPFQQTVSPDPIQLCISIIIYLLGRLVNDVSTRPLLLSDVTISEILYETSICPPQTEMERETVRSLGDASIATPETESGAESDTCCVPFFREPYEACKYVSRFIDYPIIGAFWCTLLLFVADFLKVDEISMISGLYTLIMTVIFAGAEDE